VAQATQKNAFEEKFGEGTAFNLDYGKLLIVALFVCTDTAKVLTGECEMNYSTARYFTRCRKLKSLSKDGETITTPNDSIAHWAIARLRRKPLYRWTKGQSCTNIQTGPLKWTCSNTFLLHPKPR